MAEGVRGVVGRGAGRGAASAVVVLSASHAGRSVSVGQVYYSPRNPKRDPLTVIGLEEYRRKIGRYKKGKTYAICRRGRGPELVRVAVSRLVSREHAQVIVGPWVDDGMSPRPWQGPVAVLGEYREEADEA